MDNKAVARIVACYAPNRREGSNKRCFCPSVCLSVAYISNNSRTQRLSMPKFERKVPHLRCDSHTSFKVKRSKVRITDGRRGGIPCRPNPVATLLVLGKINPDGLVSVNVALCNCSDEFLSNFVRCPCNVLDMIVSP